MTTTTLVATAVYIGIDVAKRQLDLALHDQEACWQVSNDAAGIAETVCRLSALRAAGLPVVRANPLQVRQFARGMGKLARTDRLDARVLAHDAAITPRAPQPESDRAVLVLREWVLRRQQLLQSRTAEHNRLELLPAAIRASVNAHIVWLSAEIASCEAATRPERSPLMT